MSDNLVKSHIQMPCFILKKFEDEKHKLFYYNVKKDKIESGHAKSLYQEYGYYSADTEAFLSRYIEGPLGKIAKFIERTDFSAPVQVPPNMHDIIMKYVHALIARGPFMLSLIDQNSVFFQFLHQRQRHDLAVREAFELAQAGGLFSEYFITFMVNSTDLPFVLPTGGLYTFKNIINCPITPSRAVTLVKKGSSVASELLDGDTCRVFLANFKEHIMKMNVRAFSEEIRKDKQYIVAPQQAVLEVTRHAYFSGTVMQGSNS